MKPGPASRRSFSLRDAVMPISSRNRQSTPWNAMTKKLSSSCDDLLALQPTDEPDDDAAEEQDQPGVEEHLLQKLTGEDRHPLGLAASWAVVGLPVRMLQLLQRELQLLLDPGRRSVVQALAVRGPCGRAGTDPDLDRRDVAGLVGHVARRVHPPVPQSRHQVQRHQAARNLHHGQHHRHVGVEGDVDRRPARRRRWRRSPPSPTRSNRPPSPCRPVASGSRHFSSR